MSRTPTDAYPGLQPLPGSVDKYLMFGNTTFANNATDIAIVTQFTHVDCMVASYNVAGSTWGALVATDGSYALSTSFSSGTLTISRPNTSAAALAHGTDAAVSYFVLGRVYSTD
ncbi:MAG: hypothetical protein KKF27_21945 [Gammaproteobacteria bacterium]|nr:hypothetical protein [Gammaproteobacteria bacterium]